MLLANGVKGEAIYMDRRMYRGNMRDRYNRNVSPYRQKDPGYGDVAGGYEDACDKKYCEDERDFDRFPIGMCYVPWQCFRDLYEDEFVALKNGTLFKELDKDWYGRGC